MLSTDTIEPANYFFASSLEYNLVLYVIVLKSHQICRRDILTTSMLSIRRDTSKDNVSRKVLIFLRLFLANLHSKVRSMITGILGSTHHTLASIITRIIK